MKKVNKSLCAKWEILSTAELVETEYKDKPIDDDFFERVYKGDFVRAYRDGRVNGHQKWIINITTKAKDDEGVIHTHELEWSFDKPMTIREVLDGAKHIKFKQDGLKVRWAGVSRQWIKCVDEDLKGMTCIDAWATAKCVAAVKPESCLNSFNRLFVKNLVGS